MRPIPDEPALVHRGTLIIADLHLGIEAELAKGGVNLPAQAAKCGKRVLSLLEKTNAKRLVLLGDVKHKVPGVSLHEHRELPKFFEALRGTDVHVVKGNHDGLIEKLMPRWVTVHERQMALGKYLLTHGDKWIKNSGDCKTLVMAHNHPTIEFRDGLGFRSAEPVWVRARLDSKKLKEKIGPHRLKDCIIMPAFNGFVGGAALNCSRRLLGPYMKGIVRMAEAEAYLLDGTFLGEIKDLKPA